MVTLLLVIIYVAFISLGLPDSVIGSAWPAMYGVLGVPVSSAGILTVIIATGTVVSSFFSDKILRRLGTGLVTSISVLLTAVALFGFGFSKEFWQLCLFGIPYGIGAGSIDAALNNYVALHFKSRHMSWLHSFWGIGATLGPLLMGICLTGGLGYNGGFMSIGFIQGALVVILFISLPLWRKVKHSDNRATSAESVPLGKKISFKQTIKLPGAKPILVAFFCYCALESTAGFWASSYMVFNFNISEEAAAKWVSLFYIGITVGRLACGFVSDKIGDKNMVRIGQAIAGVGVIVMFIPLGIVTALIGIGLIGLGCAPIYPSLLHKTPDNFGAEYSQAIMGMQMACAYIGATLMSPLFGIIVQLVSIKLYPVYLVIFVALMFFMVERVNRVIKKKKALSVLIKE